MNLKPRLSFAGKLFVFPIAVLFLIVLSSVNAEAQLKPGIIASGTVVDKNGIPLPGVSIRVDGEDKGTVTDRSGRFSFLAEKGDSLTISFIGYSTRKVIISESPLLIKLEAMTAKNLDEVVVIGYGTVKKRDETGAIVTIKGNDLVKTNAFSVNQLLAGKVPGATFQNVTAQPGGGVSVNIRGGLSPRGSNYPLYVVDGIPLTSNYSLTPSLNGLGYNGGINQDPLIGLNPNDIESITVLKDASAIAIYGSNAANGVILITTKKGTEGNTKVNYDEYYTLQTPKKFLDLLDAKDFMQLNNSWGHELWLVNNNIEPYGNTNPALITPYVSKFTQQQIDGAGAGTDWLDVVMNKTGYISSHNLSLSGGSKNTQIYSSFNYIKNEGILKHSDLERYSGRFNITQKIGDRITFNSNLLLSQVKSTNASTGSTSGGAEMWPMLLTAIYFPPTIGIYDNTGNFNKGYFANQYNPAAYLIMTDNTTTNRMMFTPKLDVKILPELTATVSAGIDMQSATRKYFLPVAAQSFMNPTGQGQITQTDANNYSLEGYLTYNKNFKQHRVTVVAGAGYYNTTGDGLNMIGYGYFTDNFGVDNIGIASNLAKNSFGSNRWAWDKLSQFARIDYSYGDKYLLTFTGRRDGASVFAPNKKWGIFPGASAAWRINEEDILKDAKWLSNLKLRIGYGSTGNASILNNNALSLYQMIQGASPYVLGGVTYYGMTQTQIGNPNIGWETDVTFNAGLDFGFWDERLTGSFDYFSRTAKHLLDYTSLPNNNPVTSIATNVGSTRSNGFEIALASKNVVSKNFNWSTQFSLSTYEAFWVERNPMVSLPSYVGKHDPIHAIYGWKTDGIIQSQADIPSYMPNASLGNIKYVDVNKDGKLDINDVVQLGNGDPKWNLGFNNTFTYKRLDLTVYFYGLLGFASWNDYANYGSPSNLDGTQTSNADAMVKNAWSTFNPKGSQPGIAPDKYTGGNPTGTTDFNMIKKTNFIRLQNIELGYTIQRNEASARRVIKNMRVFANFQNLFVLTNYKGVDPEMGGFDPYPPVLNSTLGLNISF